ncbi:helix-turn-helix domain-containing protein [Flavobacterium ardleyense]|uniref:helix-turn-helix domain-containing protein n=1 Tax=Flavobacterium ardleyense TaxID=2038737 RepID=UPI00298C27AD|nr:helix-turn-helix domain-containing protein [Flavobacterium ardleyense]
MNEIGKNIREARKAKGYTQEELAELCGINLRTIQRVENNENQPSGNTLKSILAVLEIENLKISDIGKHSDKTFLTFFHLSVITFIFIPIGNIILPLILWLTKRDKIAGLQEVGANLLNFQILWSTLSALVLLTYLYFKISHYPLSEILGYAWISLSLINVVIAITFAVKTYKGTVGHLYPNILRLIK